MQEQPKRKQKKVKQKLLFDVIKKVPEKKEEKQYKTMHEQQQQVNLIM